MLDIHCEIILIMVHFIIKWVFFCFAYQIDEIEGGHSALHLACHEGHCEIIKELLDRGANGTVLVIN